MMIEIIKTDDGSNTIYRKDIDETYHSRHGALTESLHVFIQTGLDCWIANHPDEDVSVLEVGFGTGMNAVLTLQYSQTYNREIYYVTLEPFPLDLPVIHELDLFPDNPEAKKSLITMHELSWSTEHQLGSFIFRKQNIKLEDFRYDKRFDVVYFDAFAPEKQPEIWEPQIMEKLYELMKRGGIMTTYCAKGEFKRNLKKAGFSVFSVPGPAGGKREIVKACKD